ncbi:uncharacterized protein LOC123709889 [Pieris brassicae]|uniref:Uncharacterized protein n=1 Tax=Pieris brassicae TaxID=7116 RepID=A0A9P0T826_PIEBR|nr:uncharacterized protein LOC123709889 [Pieris brassicae]CAH4027366.1 unnamed protein product [Pieris brassicae]
MSKLQWQIAQETQLLAEERWIIKALQLVKKERNSLQIERLSLESIKMQRTQGSQKVNKSTTNEPSASLIDIMKNFKKSNSEDMIVYEENMTTACNEEELNLTCSNSVFGHMSEEEDIEEEEDLDFLIENMNSIINTEPDKADETLLG